MNLPNIGGLVKAGKLIIMANRPELLFGASIASTIAAVGLAARGGYKARGLVEEYQHPDVNFQQPTVPMETKDKFKLTWLCYMPAVVATVGSVGSTTGLHLVHISEKKALVSAALAATEEVKEMAREMEVSDEKAKEIKAKVLGERADENGVSRVMNTDGIVEELYLVTDGRSGRTIWSNETRIDDAVNKVNQVLNKQGDCELNTFYGHAGFELLFPEGDDWGWSGDHVELAWSNAVRDDGRPTRRFDFRKSPTEGYCDAH